MEVCVWMSQPCTVGSRRYIAGIHPFRKPNRPDKRHRLKPLPIQSHIYLTIRAKPAHYWTGHGHLATDVHVSAPRHDLDIILRSTAQRKTSIEITIAHTIPRSWLAVQVFLKKSCFMLVMGWEDYAG